MDWLTAVPWYIWLVIAMLIVIPLLIVILIFRGGWQWKVLHFFKDGSFELFSCDREEGKIAFKPYRKGFGKKGESVEKVIVTEPCTMIHSPVAYRVYVTNEDCPTTIPPPKELSMSTIKCPKCQKEVEVPNPISTADVKPVVISLSQTRGFIGALRQVSEHIKRGPLLNYVLMVLVGFALGGLTVFMITVMTGHYVI